MTEPRPAAPADAVARALRMVGKGGQYILGTGDYHPVFAGGRLTDVPWTPRGDVVGSDCAGFAICFCFKLQRHRVGYNHGPWASVSDDLNTNSAIEDADHGHDLFERVISPQPGDLLCYPTFRLVDKTGHTLTFIGHVGIVVSCDRVMTWDPMRPAYHLLDIAQCKGPNGRAPGVIRTDGSLFEHHDAVWPKYEHRVAMLRALP